MMNILTGTLIPDTDNVIEVALVDADNFVAIQLGDPYRADYSLCFIDLYLAIEDAVFNSTRYNNQKEN